MNDDGITFQIVEDNEAVDIESYKIQKQKQVVGERFGKLVVVEWVGKVGKRNAVLCQCDCGQRPIIHVYKLLRKHHATKSCGCGQHEPAEQSAYNSWKSARERCNQPTHHAYQNYGGRGIRMCDRWLGVDGFKNFLDDMGERPEGTTLDRIDTDGDYTPKNCRWASYEEQAENRRNNPLRPTNLVRELLQYLGADLNDPNIIETPLRVVRSWKEEIFCGYQMDPAKILATRFPTKNDQMVICSHIDFHSTCSHHMLPFIGVAHVAYIPKGQVCGISKLVRVVEAFSRRFQLQEDMTDQIARAINQHLNPLGVGVIVKAQHLCMRSRGVKQRDSVMTTSALIGVFERPEVRAEFLSLIKEKS